MHRTPIFGWRAGKILVCLLCGLCAVRGNSLATDTPKVARYVLEISIIPAEERMTGTAQITVSNTTGNPLNKIDFLLYRLLVVESAEDEHGAPLAYHQGVVSMSDEKNWQVNSVSVRLPNALGPGSNTEITLKYSGAIFGYQEVMAYVRDHIGEDYALLRPDALAYPILAQASFQSLVAASDTHFTYDVEVTVPSGMIVACGGRLRGTSAEQNTETFRFGSDVPTWRIDVAAAKFKVLKSSTGNLIVYALPEDESSAASLPNKMERVIGFYSGRFGPSERAKSYTVVEIPEGYGSQASDGYILLVADALKDPEGMYQLYHEIGHAWNAQAKLEVQRARWLDEAFASYFEALAVREFAGQKPFDDLMLQYRQQFRNAVKRDSRNATTPIAEYGKEERGENSYTIEHCII